MNNTFACVCKDGYEEPDCLRKNLLNFSSPSQRRGALFRALARGEGTNSARLFTPGERKALAKFINDRGPVTMVHGWTSSLISKIWLFASSGISKISIFKSIYLENQVSHNEL